MAIVDIRERRRLGTWHPLSNPSDADFTIDGSRIVVKSTIGEVAVVAVREGTVLSRFVPERADEGANVLFAASDCLLVDASWSGHIRVRSATTLSVEETFAFDGEMFIGMSADCARSTWLFLHAPKAVRSDVEPESPYISIWRWPLTRPASIVRMEAFDTRAAVLSPCGTLIALLAVNRAAGGSEIQVMNLNGETLASASLVLGHCGAVVCWSSNSKMLAVTTANGLKVIDAESFEELHRVDAKYVSHVAFVDGDLSLIVGTWEGSWVEKW